MQQTTSFQLSPKTATPAANWRDKPMSVSTTSAAEPRSSRSPERLDERVALAPSGHWIMAAGLATVMIVAGGWSVFGYIPTKVIGQGTLMTSEEQAHVIEASTPGLVANLLVQDDDHVTENQIIAILEQSELVAQQRIGRNRLAELESNLASVRLQSAQELTSRETVMAALTNTLTFQAEEAQKRTERLTGLLDMMTDLSARGMTRKIEVEKIRQDRDSDHQCRARRSGPTAPTRSTRASSTSQHSDTQMPQGGHPPHHSITSSVR
jgi:multidrug resistance efflux pump